MESEWFDVDVYRLINLYELHPTLYDVTEVNYRNREMKKFLESQIAYSLNKPVADIRKKWANLRTQFVKELREVEKKKSGSGDNKGKSRWKYFRSMSFLTAMAAPTPAKRKSNLELVQTDTVKQEPETTFAETASTSTTLTCVNIPPRCSTSPTTHCTAADTARHSPSHTDTARASTTSTASHAANASTSSTTAATPKRAKKRGDVQNCYDVVTKYYSTRLNSVASSEKQTDEDTFCQMLAAEMKKVNRDAVKRALKRKLFDAVMAAQEEGDQVSESNVLHQSQAQDTSAQQTKTSAESADVMDLDLDLDCSSSC